MRLNPGTRLGPYEIVSLLGVGGMGEVYRARDPRLQRDVALKVLPDVAASDPGRRERFTREALAVAAINHPHIVTIHSVEDAGPKVLIAMELIEGRSLAEVLPPGGLSTDRVLTIGIAIAEAMSAAHQKGITHRDLKPGNIMIGEGEHAGRIKVLDFGLAKRAGAGPGSSSESMLPTVEGPGVGPITGAGQILGTVAYMSPEQAEGKPIDARSDLFSLGIVLYECATGQRPFTGDSSLSILSSIVRDTPRAVTEINPALPQDLARIVRRALAKDPERRYQSAKDLRNDLEDLRTSLAPEVSLPSSGPRAPAPGAKFSPTSIAAAVVLLVGAVAGLGWLLGRGPRTAPAEQPGPSAPIADRVTRLTESGIAGRPTLSPDGNYVVYVQHDRNGDSLWLRETTGTSKSQIVAPEPGVTLFGATFTPDARSVDFVRQHDDEEWDIWRVPFIGGPARPFIGNVTSPISWSPDGQRLAFLRGRSFPTISSTLVVSDAEGGHENTLAASEPEGALWVSLLAPWRPSFAPAWSPDGRMLAIAAVNEVRGQVVFVDSQSGSQQSVPMPTSVTSGIGWLNSQALVVSGMPSLGSLNQLFLVPYPSGQPATRLTNDPNDYIGASLSGNRRDLVTSRFDGRMDIWVGDRTGVSGRTVIERVRMPVSLARIAWSGDRLLYGGFEGGRPAIMSVTPGGTGPEEILGDAVTPGAARDGRIVFHASSSALGLWVADASGRRIAPLAPEAIASLAVVTPDDSVLYGSLAKNTPSIWTVPIAGGTRAKLVDGANAAVSPDGRALAFTAPSRGRPSLVVCELPDCTTHRPIGPAAFETQIAWMPDGLGVAFARDGNLWVQPVAGGPARQFTRFTDTRPIGTFAWSRDGSRLAITRSTVTNDIVLFSGLRRD